MWILGKPLKYGVKSAVTFLQKHNYPSFKPRIARIVASAYPHHVAQRGHNPNTVFLMIRSGRIIEESQTRNGHNWLQHFNKEALSKNLLLLREKHKKDVTIPTRGRKIGGTPYLPKLKRRSKNESHRFITCYFGRSI